MNNRVVAAAIGVACLLAGMPRARACGSDVECKGDRICDNQICVSPRQAAPVPGACRADVDCPANNLCTGGACTPESAPPAALPPPVAVPPPAALAPPPVATPPPVLRAPEAPSAGDTWQYDGQPPPPRPLAPPVLVMRNPRLRSAGIALVTLGIAMEVIGIGVLASSANSCATSPREYNADACVSSSTAGSLLVLFGIPMIANGAWMWPVGGHMVPQEESSNTRSNTGVKPYIVARRDGGGFGLQLAF